MQEKETTELQPQIILMNELARRTSKNPHYSARAFAKSLGVSHTLLSLILSSKRNVSKKLAKRIVDSFSLNEMEVAVLKGHKQKHLKETEYDQVSLDAFSLLSDWHH